MVARGETFGLIGPDGAGKTTTVRLLAGLLTPTQGQITILGYNPRHQGHAFKAHIGYMAQQFSLYGDLTVMENLRFFANVLGASPKAQATRIPQLLRFAGLEGFEGRLGDQLSGGMKKKLALACMLVHDPEVVFLDEPTLGVDPVSRREFWDLLAELRTKRGLTIFMCTPYMDEAERCHRVGLIYNGRLIAEGTPREIKRLVPGQLLDCWPSDFEQAKALAPALPGVLEVQILGDRLRLFVDDAALRAPQIKTALARHNIVLTGDLRVVQPRMEEAFISLIQRQAFNA
jgi:ABC-2 type transport system ATP-binding protein